MNEIDILYEIHDLFDCLLFDYVSIACEYLFKYDLIWLLFALLLIRKPDSRIIGKTMILALIFDVLICWFFKLLIVRPRPYEAYGLDILVNSMSSSSFPSGHTMTAFCMATVLWVFDRLKGAWMYTLALLIGLTRMYLYVHYLSDVLYGAFFGILCAYLAVFMLHRGIRRTVYVEAGNVNEDQSA